MSGTANRARTPRTVLGDQTKPTEAASKLTTTPHAIKAAILHACQNAHGKLSDVSAVIDLAHCGTGRPQRYLAAVRRSRGAVELVLACDRGKADVLVTHITTIPRPTLNALNGRGAVVSVQPANNGALIRVHDSRQVLVTEYTYKLPVG